MTRLSFRCINSGQVNLLISDFSVGKRQRHIADIYMKKATRIFTNNNERMDMKTKCPVKSDSNKGKSSLFKLNPSQQMTISIALLTVIPSMVSFFTGRYVAGETVSIPYAALLGLITVALVFAGYRIYKKYPDNIAELRHFVSGMVDGVIPDHLALMKTYESNDLLYIEQSLNAMIGEMKKKQEVLVKLERHRTLTESVSILVKKISRPLRVLRSCLMKLDIIAPMDEEHIEINRCLKEVEHIRKDIKTVMNSCEMKPLRESMPMVDLYRKDPVSRLREIEKVSVEAREPAVFSIDRTDEVDLAVA